MRELSHLFNRFRLAHLNARYNARKAQGLERYDRALQMIIAILTGVAFAVLGFSEFVPSHGTAVKVIALIASVAAFLVSTAAPWFGLASKLKEARTAASAWSTAALQIEAALRFVRDAGAADGEVAGWVSSADFAYQTAASLPSTEDQDAELVASISREIEEAFPTNYVWTSL